MRLVVGKDGSQSVTLPGGKILCRSYDRLAPDLRDTPAGFAPKKLSLDDETEIPELDSSFDDDDEGYIDEDRENGDD